MAEIQKLLDVIKESTSSSSSLSNLSQSLCSESSVNLGFQKLYSILNHALEDSGVGKKTFLCWQLSQIRCIVSVLQTVVLALRSLSVEIAEPIVVATVQVSIDFATSCLEKIEFSWDDTSLQDDLIHFLETALADKANKLRDVALPDCSILEDLVPLDTVQRSSASLGYGTQCNVGGAHCLREERTKDLFVMALTSDYVSSERELDTMSLLSTGHTLDSIVSVSRHWAALHLRCIDRLVQLSRTLAELSLDFDEAAIVKRLSLSLRILKLLGCVAKETPFIERSEALLQAVALWTETLPNLFGHAVDCISTHTSAECSIESIGLLMLEDFLLLVKIIFGNTNLLQNIQACIVAALFNKTNPCKWGCNKAVTMMKTPLVFTPRAVVYVLKLMDDVQRQKYQCVYWRVSAPRHHGNIVDSQVDSLSCRIQSEKIYLLKQYTVDELLNIIFPSSKQWLDNMIHLASFFHSEGVRLYPKLDRSNSSCVKPGGASEVENSLCHDDEALFGDLFSEGSRSIASGDGSVSPSSVDTTFSYGSMSIRAASELLDFLKGFIFAPEKQLSVYENSCKQFNEFHIDTLLSIINCRNFHCDEKTGTNEEVTHERTKIVHVHDLSFHLMHNIVTFHSLSGSLEDYLVKKIFDTEGGSFVYNDMTLTLSAQILICRAGSASDELAAKIYTVYADFIISKANDVISKCVSLREVIETLPSVLHVEILLLAFHLCSETGKATLANFILSCLKSVKLPNTELGNKQLSCWAIVVSRLILVFRHMIFHSSTCPPQLLLDLRSKLRDAQFTGIHSSNGNPTVHYTWVATVDSLIGSCLTEDPVVKILIPHLIDFVSFPASLSRKSLDIRCLSLSWDDLCVCLLQLIGLWCGKQAITVEDLILERYMFALCWDIPSINSHLLIQRPINANEVDDTSVEQCLHVSHMLVGRVEGLENPINVPEMIVDLFKYLDVSTISLDVSCVGWDFFRRNMRLSLVLSLLDTGISAFSLKEEDAKTEFNLTEEESREKEYLSLTHCVAVNIFKTGKVSVLLKLLSSLLQKCLEVYQRTLSYSFDDVQSQSEEFSPILLLKNTEYEKQDELIKKCGYDPCHLQALYDILPKIDATVNKRVPGVLPKILWESMLHGLPIYNHLSSGAIFSYIFLIRRLICILEDLLKTTDVVGDLFLETEMACQILDSVLTVKSDKIFEALHGKCKAICRSLTPNLGAVNYSVIYFLKKIEMILLEINVKQVRDGTIHDWMVTRAIDKIDALKKDPSLSATYRFFTCENQCEEVRGLHRSDFMFLVDSLDNCSSETVDIKALSLFSEILTEESSFDFKKKLQKKFLGMNVLAVSKWLERRILGLSVEAPDGSVSVRVSSQSLRETSMSFVLCLASSSSELPSQEIQNHFFEAAMQSLNTAFLMYDISAAESYFHFVAQLSKSETSTELLVKKTVLLLDKLVENEKLLQGLKFLLCFLGSLLSEYGCSTGHSDKYSLKSVLSSSIGTRSNISRVTCESSESLVFSANDRGGSASIESDAISVDEDDDGTSDGEEASLDKDEEEDVMGENALASKVCTFTSSGSNFMEQHWYFCYTCDLTLTKGCCSVCAKVCHRGHRVVYSRSSRFFCDCGAGGVQGSNCQCLKPRKLITGNSAVLQSGSSLHPTVTGTGRQLLDSDSDVDENLSADVENPVKFSIPRELQNRLSLLLMELDIEGKVIKLCSSVMQSIVYRRETNLSQENKVKLGENKSLCYGADLLQLKKAYKSGSMDLKMKVEYSNTKEVKALVASGSLVKSLLSVNVRGRLAVGEGDKIAIYDVGQLIGQATVAPVTADKANVKALSKNLVRFEIMQITFNPLVENHLAVAGYEDCQVLTISPRGEVTDRLPIELALQGSFVRRVDWVPGSQVQLMVVANSFVKIYDLSQDNISPLHYFTLPDGMIVDAYIIVSSLGSMFLIVLSEIGSLFRLEISMDGDVGAKQLKEVIPVGDQEHIAHGSSLYFSEAYKLLFVSYKDGTSLVGRLNSDATLLTEISYIYENEDDNPRPASLHRWKELHGGSGSFACFSSMKSTSLAIAIGSQELIAQNLRHAIGSSSPLVGITAYKPLSKDKIHCLVLHDDGSLQIYSHVPLGVDAGLSESSDKVKKLGPHILENDAHAGTNPEFPLDFFEKTFCITADVKLGGDAVKNSDSEGVKQNLASDDGFLESHSPSGFKITVSNLNPDVVMVGFRVHVGNTSSNSIPSSITIFHRVIKLDEGMRSWYDIPFTVGESLLADEEFTITVGPAFNGSCLPRIDSLEVYGRAKDEFGWKEKMDAVLDVESRISGSDSWVVGSGKEFRSMQFAPIHDQVVAEGLKLLSTFYLVSRFSMGSNTEEVLSELSKLKCKILLETIFECDKEPLLQAAASRVLQTIYPRKELYKQAKDTLRLVGVLKSTSMISARMGIGCPKGRWIVEEFTAQLRAVSKIALKRRSNLAAFLEINGSEVVDGLMQVLWGILDLEQLDTQTTNKIVISSVELIYCYAECLALHGKEGERRSVAPAVSLLKKLLLSPNEAIQTSSSLALSSRLLQVPFPKQTLLSADDVENIASTLLPVDTPGATSQMIIEDDGTPSVQYCCDGCNTVPIPRRRWHCTVCPDFDLCDACHELFGAGRLPSQQHPRDHSMTAIPVEAETAERDSNVLHLSSADLTDHNLLQVPTEASTRNSAASIHVLDTNESEECVLSTEDLVSISVSKQAVNSLLLAELLDQLKGCLRSTTGVRAIPIMQFFYRLASAVGGPLVHSSKTDRLNLERLIRWLLDEININQPFTPRPRSSFGEVTILIFMFFTLMLRNWHQPGNDSSESKPSGPLESQDRNLPTGLPSQPSMDDQVKSEFASQLLQACSALRQQSFVIYLMNILQQLMQVFKSSSMAIEAVNGNNSGVGCGMLLSIRRELPAGNFSPFFSDSYVKAHRMDVFMDYFRLLLENVFRLLYSLIRPEKQDKGGEKDKLCKSSSGKELKLDGYQDVLCSYINNLNTTFIRRYARRLFLHMCGSKAQYYSIRDFWQLTNEFKRLQKHINKSGGFQNSASYERSIKIVKCLSAMAEIAAARPRNWQKYCLKHGDILPYLLDGVFHFGEESVIQTLKLLNIGFYMGKESINSVQKSETEDGGKSLEKPTVQKKKKGEDATEVGLEKSNVDMESVVNIFFDKGGDVLMQFVDYFLLEWNSISVRAEAKSLLFGVWYHAKQPFKENLLVSLLRKVSALPAYGQNITEYTELICLLLGKGSDSSMRQQATELVDQCLTADVVKCIFDTLHSQNELLANHPNSRIYNTLSGLVEFNGYYLESEPCVACSSPEVPYSKMKLESLKYETKFTDNRILVKCTGSYTIQTVTMNVHDARKSKSVKVLNLYYNNRPVADLSELKNNWSLWKRAKSCHLVFNQTELKVDFPIPITACNFMIELDSFYENLQALSLEPLQCPRCSRPVTDKHGICINCHENAYQCRQCRNINYENLNSFLCNECGYSKYGRFEFNFMAKPSFTFDSMENDDDMKKGLAAIESESENAHRRYQQLLGFKKPLLKILSSVGENEMDSLQKDAVQQMMVSLPGPSCKINRKIALLGVLYGEKCKTAFDSVNKSVQTLQGLRRVLMNYLHDKHRNKSSTFSKFSAPRTPYSCYGCAANFVTQCLEILQVLSKHPSSKKQLVSYGIMTELFENNIHQGPKTARVQARAALSALSEGDLNAVTELNSLILKKVMYCLEHHRSLDISVAIREEMLLLSEVCSLSDDFWESRLRLVFQLLFSAIKLGGKHPAISEYVILPCLRIVSAACTPPKPDILDKERGSEKPKTVSLPMNENISKQSNSPGNLVSGSKPLHSSHKNNGDCSSTTQDMQLLSYAEWERGATYVDFVRRQYKVSLSVKGSSPRSRAQRCDFLALKYGLRWKRCACHVSKGELSSLELGLWVTELVFSACSQSLRSEMCMLITLLCAHSSARTYRLLNLLFTLLPATLSAGESAAEYFELVLKMTDTEEARLFLTVRGGLSTICKLISSEVKKLESLEWSSHIDISQGFILHKLIELLHKFLEVPNIRFRFMQDNLLFEILEALIVIRGLIVQKTKLTGDCNRLLKDLLDGLLIESTENKRQFISACIRGLQIHGEDKKGRNTMFILEQLCNLICPSKPESVYFLVLNKAHTQEEFIRGSMKNPYSSAEIGPLMRDVKNKICHQLDLLGLVEDDYGMELLVAGNIISLDLSISQVYEQVWKKSSSHPLNNITNSTLLSSNQATSSRDGSPLVVTYRLQGLDGEATEPMIKEVEEDREESLDPEVEFAIAGAVREYNGLQIILGMVQRLRDDLKANQEQLIVLLNLLMLCCKIRENRRTLLKLGSLGLLLDTARRAFSVDAMELAESILLIVESLTLEANDSDNVIGQSSLTFSSEESGTGEGEQAKKIILMFLERLSHTSGLKKSQKQQRYTEMVARILPYLTYGEPAAMEALIQHFEPFLKNWGEFDQLQKQHEDNPNDERIAQQAAKQRFALENFVRISESLKTSTCGERLKDIILEKGITATSVKHLRECFATIVDGGFSKSSTEWTSGLKLPSVPLILSMLRGLSMGHMSTQKCIDEGDIMPLLHALEGVPGENEIGARAENLLDTLSDKEGKGDGFFRDKISSLRHASRNEMRRLALKKRQQVLQGLGMHQEHSDGGDRIVVSRPFEGLEDVEEENGLACMVCREGYSLRPADLLGVYSYSKRVNLGSGNSGIARGECVYTTVSHFNIIHFQCHQEAKRADAALKAPKKEWEGATLRNNETLCNSLFPVRGPSVPTTQYIRYVDQHWDNLSFLGRADGSRLRLLTYDIVLMLARFATGALFNQDCKGGGRESNSRFLPFMIQMACHLLDQGGLSQRRSMGRSLSAYISHATPDSKLSTSLLGTQASGAGTEETVQFMMINSLLSESYESWLKHRRTFLQRGIYHAYTQHVHGRSNTRSSSSPSLKYVLESTTGSSTKGLLQIFQPMLVYTGLIEHLQRFLKLKKPGSAMSDGTSAGKVTIVGDDFEQWEVVMRERLLNVMEMVGYSKELLSWLEDMISASDLQEAFDVMGMLADVLSDSCTSCEDFVQSAIDAGKSI